MKRYPDGAAGPFFFMKRAPSPRPAVDRDVRHRARLRQRHRFSDHPGPRVAALGDQPRMHRPEPLVRALRRRRPPRLPALRPRPREGRARSRRCGRPRSSSARRSTAWACRAIPRPPARRVCTSTCPSSAARRRKRSGTWRRPWRQALEQARPALITAEYRIARRPPGRVLVDYNQNAWGRTLASVYSVRPRPRATVSRPGDVGGGRARRARSRTFASTMSPPASRASATCGSHFCPRAAASGWTDLG